MTTIEIITLIITGLIGGGIGYLFKSLLESKKFNHRLIENLYEKRYKTYTKLLEITQDLGKNTKDVELCKKAREELKQWQKTSGGFLLMSKETLQEFNNLKDVLKKNPEKKEEYSDKQRKNIFKARNSFRGSLRDEFKFFHSAESKQ